MNSIVLEPQKLRPAIIHQIESMDDQSLLMLHHVLLHMEKERLWHDLSSEFETDRCAGKYERLPDVIAAARKELRR